MKHLSLLAIALLLGQSLPAQSISPSPAQAAAVQISKTKVSYLADLDLLVFSISVEGEAGSFRPPAAGQLDGAPVLGYVFPTSLKPENVGFSSTEGIVALALTAHPDFDDTPLWDENADADYSNDGVVWHPHWVVLHEDSRVPGGLAVRQYKKDDTTVVLPPTNPGMPMYMDSPGYPVIHRGKEIKVLVPAYRIHNQKDFRFDAVTAYMQVNTSDSNRPMLGVYQVFSIASGDLSLPYQVSHKN